MSYTKKPKMILFDVGGTLFNDGKCEALDGFRGLIAHADNPDAGDLDKMVACWDGLLNEITPCNRSVSGYTVDMPLYSLIKYAAMNCGLKFSISPAQQEELFDRYNSSRALTPGIVKLINTLNELGIRTAVISNNMMSGESLALAVEHWLPQAKMEFCLTSADLQLCKPWSGLFTTAAAFSGLDCGDCWYCGDSMVPDVDGCRGAGMTPVYIDQMSQVSMEYRTDGNREPFMTVNDWSALADYLRTLD